MEGEEDKRAGADATFLSVNHLDKASRRALIKVLAEHARILPTRGDVLAQFPDFVTALGGMQAARLFLASRLAPGDLTISAHGGRVIIEGSASSENIRFSRGWRGNAIGEPIEIGSIVESKKPGYTGERSPIEASGSSGVPDGEPSGNIDSLADHLPEQARAPFKQRVWSDFEAARTIAERGAAAGLSALQIAAAIENDTLVDRLVRFHKGLREVELPEGGFTTPSRQRREQPLGKPFTTCKRVRRRSGCRLRKKPEQIREAGTHGQRLLPVPHGNR